ncbi:ABC transporter permease subunit [Brevibacillus formosus]|uniref:ABC transporter permease n=1 Tax=Brevibacillus formosus TaxID=54913 RepID=UPI001CA53D10|nr:ABC transporter permease [Brevibacillus formosus]MBW5466979.1 ABC transporter permease subunit [Brevibacillus formosus]
MYNLIKSEWYKLRKDRSFRTLAMIIVALSIFWPLYWHFDNLLDGDPLFTGLESFQRAISGNTFIIKVSLCILAGFFISSEYSTGVMKNMATSGNSRMKIFTAKLCVYSWGVILLSLLFPVFNMVISTLLSGFGAMDDQSAALLVLRTMLGTILYSASFASVAALFAIIFTNSGKTISASIIFFLTIDVIFTNIGEFIPVFETVYENSVFSLVEDIGGISPSNTELWRLTVAPILTFVGCGLAGCWVYRKKEIK